MQSLDGQVSFFDQEVAAFDRHLPGALLPGPIAWCPETDALVTVTAAMELESYPFISLAAASAEKEPGTFMWVCVGCQTPVSALQSMGVHGSRGRAMPAGQGAPPDLWLPFP